ncbi:uncharacterized protein BDR25DRAFT_346929 [Lindgomyces ingoldianus]|uniref:Uncharacterized protein n=1 Tax=Lindgomyces ingoldianus TaxID=673940 RepID=A0ACB6QCW2_9PLEO|nr:uncharacterized protein BDR25DRAFT_346929 [Lindgomyces ingoldianus]KAF2463957.1 hypothetical protein BDR25DRAFT_346929 [Lindgomyces ingoldianus]
MQYSQVSGSGEVYRQHDTPIEVHETKPTRFSRLWTAIVQMAVLLILGIAGSLVHFFYYRSLVGHVVDDGFSISQEWNIRIGTGLAFVSKTSWTFAVVVAHAQLVWMTMSRKKLRLETIDGIIMAPTDLTKFFQWGSVRNAKVGTLLALVAWCIPISAIVTPSTLSVVSVVTTDAVSSTVPILDLNNVDKFADSTPCPNALLSFCPRALNPENLTSALIFRYASPQTDIQTVATASSGQIQAMTPLNVNESYSLQMYGPVMRCVNGSDRFDEFHEFVENTQPFGRYLSTKLFSYWAFVPSKFANGTKMALDWTKLPSGTLDNGVNYKEYNDTMIPSAPELWMTTYWSMDICSLHNASFQVDFAFEKGVQRTKSKVETLEPLKWKTAVSGADAVGNQTFTYQAIYMALVRQLIGLVVDNPIDSNVMQTSVSGSIEFEDYFYGTLFEQPYQQNKTLRQTVEELSENVTLSMLASKAHVQVSSICDLILN